MDTGEEFDESCVTIRKAYGYDGDSILAIHDNVFGGIDYMPIYVNKFLSCPYTRSYVACYKGNVVGFCAEYVVDDGLTGVMRGARVKPNFKGKGVYKQLTEFARSQSTTKIQAFTSNSLNPSPDRQSFREQNRLILQRATHSYLIDSAFWKYRGEESVGTQSNVKKTDHEFIQNYLGSSALMSYLFPQGRIIIHWVPYRVSLSNVPLLDWHNSSFYTSVSERQDGKTSGLLSISTSYKTLDPTYFINIDVYGTDIDVFGNHIQAHLNEITKDVPFPIGLVVFTDMSVKPEALDTILAQYGIARCKKSCEWKAMTEQVLFEKQ